MAEDFANQLEGLVGIDVTVTVTVQGGNQVTGRVLSVDRRGDTARLTGGTVRISAILAIKTEQIGAKKET